MKTKTFWLIIYTILSILGTLSAFISFFAGDYIFTFIFIIMTTVAVMILNVNEEK